MLILKTRNLGLFVYRGLYQFIGNNNHLCNIAGYDRIPGTL